MNTIVSYPDRGEYGKSSYRGNCSGLLIEDLIKQYKLESLSDFMVGSGTTEDVVRKHDLRGTFADLNRGYDMLNMKIPERAENIFWHPPYHDMIVYSGEQYSDRMVIDTYGFDPKAVDLSRCADWDEFVKKMNHCMMKQFASLEKGGRMFTLVGDMKRKGVLYSMLCDIVKPGTLEQIIIKTQHNCVSDRNTYTNRNFVPIVHEYLLVTKKDNELIIPVSMTVKRNADIRQLHSPSWRDVLHALLKESDEMSLQELYASIDGSQKTRNNPHWKEKVRQTLQNNKYFIRTSKGIYKIAS